MWRLTTAVVFLCAGTAAVQADEIPACALTGSSTVLIGGKPALRLSDVANCAPELYEIIASVKIDGQPMVHFKSARYGKFRCIPSADVNVFAEGKSAGTTGETACSENAE